MKRTRQNLARVSISVRSAMLVVAEDRLTRNDIQNQYVIPTERDVANLGKASLSLKFTS
jgi:hypothetical protein